MKRSRLASLGGVMLVVAGLACAKLEEIHQDPSYVLNPDLSDEQREATRWAGVGPLIFEQKPTFTATTYNTPALSAPTIAPTFTHLPAASAITSATPAATVAENRPPVITSFTANFVPNDRTTYYKVVAYDPDGPPADPVTGPQKLKYQWVNTNSCGTFNWDTATLLSNSATWHHPHPPCRDERYHPAFIRVVITDPQGGQATFEYYGGSASGQIILITPPP